MKNLIALFCMTGYIALVCIKGVARHTNECKRPSYKRVQLGFSFIPQKKRKKVTFNSYN